jgi:hypothetical protein
MPTPSRCDAQAWGATWADDAQWSLPDYPEIGTTHGREAIVAMWVEAMKHYPGIMFEAWPGSIEVHGDKAVMRSYTAGSMTGPMASTATGGNMTMNASGSTGAGISAAAPFAISIARSARKACDRSHGAQPLLAARCPSRRA